jgi:hypothetical protein
MFGLFKANPKEKLEKEYAKLLEQAMQAQRKGDIELCSSLSFEADKILKQIEAMEAADKSN